MKAPLVLAVVIALALGGCNDRDTPPSAAVQSYKYVVIRSAPTDDEAKRLADVLAGVGLKVIPRTEPFLKVKNADSQATLIANLKESTGQYLSEATLELKDYLSDSDVFRKTRGASTAKEADILPAIVAELERQRKGAVVESDDLDEQRRAAGGEPTTSASKLRPKR